MIIGARSNFGKAGLFDTGFGSGLRRATRVGAHMPRRSDESQRWTSAQELLSEWYCHDEPEQSERFLPCSNREAPLPH